MKKEKVQIEFQYVKPGEIKPSSTYLSDVLSPVDSAAMIPSKGDLITLLVGHPREEARLETFKVIAKNYHYRFKDEK